MFNETATRDAKIQEWKESQRVLAEAKENEIRLRNEVLNGSFGEDRIGREGTENIELGNGYKLKAVFKQSRTLSTKKDAVDKALTKIEDMGEEGKFVAERLVNWKPSLVKKEYEALPPKYKKIFDKVVTTKPSTPTLELVVPKSK